MKRYRVECAEGTSPLEIASGIGGRDIESTVIRTANQFAFVDVAEADADAWEHWIEDLDDVVEYREV